jgi:hypothetical protein
MFYTSHDKVHVAHKDTNTLLDTYHIYMLVLSLEEHGPFPLQYELQSPYKNDRISLPLYDIQAVLKAFAPTHSPLTSASHSLQPFAA